MIAEFDAVVSVVANSLRALPATLDTSKERPREVGEHFGVAIATSQQKGENLTRQLTYIPLLRCRADLVWKPAVLDDKIAADFEEARRGHKPGTDIAVGIKEVPRLHARRKTHGLIAKDVPIAGRMGGEHKHHWNCVGTLKGNVIACPDFHKDLHRMCDL